MGIIDTALSYAGKVKYVFGADNIDGGEGDCSSFTETVFRKNGYEIGTDTETQWTSSASTLVNDLQCGDLVFFKNTYDSGHIDGVSHVGIYEGDGLFVHLSSGGVKESSLNSGYYAEHFLGAKRVEGVSSNESITSSNLSIDAPTNSLLNNIVMIIICFLLIGGAVIALVLAVK